MDHLPILMHSDDVDERNVMKTLLLTLTVTTLTLVISKPAVAEDVKWSIDNVSYEQPYLRKGHFEVGGGLSLGFSDKGDTEYEIAPKVEYFIMDRLSLGGFASNSSSKTVSRLTIGPSLSWYFLSLLESKVFAFVNQSFGLQRREIKVDNTLNTLVEKDSLLVGRSSLGLKVFILNTLALGSAIELRYSISDVDEPVSDLLTKAFLSFHF